MSPHVFVNFFSDFWMLFHQSVLGFFFVVVVGGFLFEIFGLVYVLLLNIN